MNKMILSIKNAFKCSIGKHKWVLKKDKDGKSYPPYHWNQECEHCKYDIKNRIWD